MSHQQGGEQFIRTEPVAKGTLLPEQSSYALSSSTSVIKILRLKSNGWKSNPAPGTNMTNAGAEYTIFPNGSLGDFLETLYKAEKR